MTSPNTIIADMQAEIDALRKENNSLMTALDDAAMSLETIALRSYGEESYLDSKQQMRGYAGSRAGAAREEIASVKGGK